MVVTFYRTTNDGQKRIGRVRYDKVAGLTYSNAGIRLADLLFENGKDTPEKIEAAMRRAPLRFDGAYLRASFSE